jgi:hypothetical protein
MPAHIEGYVVEHYLLVIGETDVPQLDNGRF